jgi:hypothetical protein
MMRLRRLRLWAHADRSGPAGSDKRACDNLFMHATALSGLIGERRNADVHDVHGVS